MKPAPFHYYRAPDALAAVQALAAPEWQGGAKLLAGGQSLIPAMACRDARPSLVVDIMACADLAELCTDGEQLVIGARCRQGDLERSPLAISAVPLLVEAVRWVAIPQVRNRGTVIGSIAQANAAAEIPVVALVLDAEFELFGPEGKRKMIDARDMFSAQAGTSLDPTSLVAAGRFRAMREGEGWGFSEIQLRPGHFALVCAAAVVVVAEGVVVEASLCIGGLNQNPYRAVQAEAAPIGRAIDDDSWIEQIAVLAVRERPWPARADQHASAEYRQSAAVIAVREALESAIRRAQNRPVGTRTRHD
jgi:aerobic carbon-monoxide dehydrogenase medium subunit